MFRVYDAELDWVAFQRAGVVLLRYRCLEGPPQTGETVDAADL